MEEQQQISSLKMKNSPSSCPKCKGTGWILDVGTNTASKCVCYEEMVQSNRLKFAMIPDEFKNLTVNSFDTSIYSNNQKEIAIRAKRIVGGYINNFEEMQQQGKGLFFFSKSRGSGKTRLAVSTGNALIMHKAQRVRFITTLDLLSKIKETYSNNDEYTEQSLLNEFYEIPVLILDDIGTENVSPWVTEIFFKLLDTRMTYRRITIITSNLSIEDLKHDERIKSRLRRMTITIDMPNEDIRRKLGTEKNNDLINRLIGGL